MFPGFFSGRKVSLRRKVKLWKQLPTPPIWTSSLILVNYCFLFYSDMLGNSYELNWEHECRCAYTINFIWFANCTIIIFFFFWKSSCLCQFSELFYFIQIIIFQDLAQGFYCLTWIQRFSHKFDCSCIQIYIFKSLQC